MARKRERNSTESKQHFLLRNVLLKLHFCIEGYFRTPSPTPAPELGFVAKVRLNEKKQKTKNLHLGGGSLQHRGGPPSKEETEPIPPHLALY